MRTGAVYCIYDDLMWLPFSLSSIYAAVEKIFVLVGEKPWNGAAGDNEAMLRCVQTFADREGKISLHRGTWATETDQRNAGLDLLHAAGLDLCFIIDADEVYHELQLARMLQTIEKNPAVNAFRVWMFTYWKSYRYRVDPLEPYYPVSFLRLGGGSFVDSRNVDAQPQAIIPPQIGLCHHFSYARSDADVLKKISRFSHALEVVPRWFEDVWRAWDSNPQLENLNPAYPGSYRRAVPQPFDALPPVLQQYLQNGGTEVI